MQEEVPTEDWPRGLVCVTGGEQAKQDMSFFLMGEGVGRRAGDTGHRSLFAEDFLFWLASLGLI